MDGAKTESQRQQLRELLAKQMKQRQTKKKQIEEQERILLEHQPPQTWPTGGDDFIGPFLSGAFERYIGFIKIGISL